MADLIGLLNDESPEPTMRQTRTSFSDVSNWRKYAKSYAKDLAGYEVISIENNICSGARPSYVPAEESTEARLWFLPVELAREVNYARNGMLNRLTVCYERVDVANGQVLSADGLRWPPDVTGAKVTFQDLAEVDFSGFDSDDIVHNVAYNIVLSRQIKVQAERDAYLFFSLTNASLTVPYTFLEKQQANAAAVVAAIGLEDHYEQFVFLFLFVRISPHLAGSVATPQFYTTCLRYKRLLESWRQRQFVDYEEALCLKAMFELETASRQPQGGLLYNRFSMLAYFEDCGFDDILENEQYREIHAELCVLMELEEWSPLHSVPDEHRAAGSIYIGGTEYRAPVQYSSRNLSSRNVGVQARLTGRTTCTTSFDGKPAVLRVSGGTMKLLRIDIPLVLKTMAWVAANNPIYQLEDVPNPINGGYDSNRLILNALNMGLFGESGTGWILSQIIFGDVKVSSRSRNRFFKSLAQDEEGVRMDKPSRPAFTQQLAAFIFQEKVYLAVAADLFFALERRHGMWRVQSSHSAVQDIDGLGQFRTRRCVA